MFRSVYLVSLSVWSALTISLTSSSKDDYIYVPNSCRGLADGTHILKLIDGDIDDYPLVQVQCSNEMMIIDVSFESNLLSYFSSNIMWHYSIMGPTNYDHVNWHDWWLPSSMETPKYYDENGETKFDYLYSQQCDTCEQITSGHYANTPENEANYVPFMTGNMFNCFWTVRGIHSYDFDWESKECYYHVSGASTLDYLERQDNACSPVASTDMTYEEIHSYGEYLPGACATYPMNPTTEVAEFHDDCATSKNDLLYKPSIGTDGTNCVCVKPSILFTDSFKVLKSDYDNFVKEKKSSQTSQEDVDTTATTVKTRENNIVELYQSDFESGTYRITESGTYIIMEDIEFDFNAGIGNEAEAWMPQASQSDTYHGADNTWRDPYFLGFFAGITVECDNVLIDLNNKQLSQSIKFYYQQRWFSLIELGSQSFYPSQGPGFLGAEPSFASNVEIKNGILGLTSHHGIHGNNNKHLYIHDLEITRFESHGIQLNGFEDIKLYKLNIHDSSQIAYLRGEYGHARVLLPRIKELIDSDLSSFQVTEEEYNALRYNPDSHTQRKEQGVASYGDDYEVQSEEIGNDDFLKDLYNDMINQMNMVFEYAIDYNNEKNGKNNNKNKNSNKWSDDADDWNDRNKYDLWLKAKENFLYSYEMDDDMSESAVSSNGNGLPFGATVYGIFLSYHGANILTFGNCGDTSETAVLEDIEISGLRHKMHEYLRIDFVTTPFNSLIDVNTFFSDVQAITDAYYIGNTMTDAYAAIDYLSNDWGILQLMNLMSNNMAQLALGVTDEIDNSRTFFVMCNADAQTHSGKGTIGLRIDSVYNFKLHNIRISNLYDYTKKGSSACGEYHDKSRGHFLQTLPVQYGFTGNMVHGIHIMKGTGELSEIYINDIGSATGLVRGIGIYGKSTIDMNLNINVKNIMAGFQVESNELSYDDKPNRAPEACGIMFYWVDDVEIANMNTDYSTAEVAISSSNEGSLNIVNECIVGHTGCFNEEYYGATMAGKYLSCQNSYEKSEHTSKGNTIDSGLTNGISSEYMYDIDKKLLKLKDTSNDLKDFESDMDGISFDDSLDFFMNVHLMQDSDEFYDSHDGIDYLEVCIYIIVAILLLSTVVLMLRRICSTYCCGENYDNTANGHKYSQLPSNPIANNNNENEGSYGSTRPQSITVTAQA